MDLDRLVCVILIVITFNIVWHIDTKVNDIQTKTNAVYERVTTKNNLLLVNSNDSCYLSSKEGKQNTKGK